MDDKRKFPRIATDVHVGIGLERSDRGTREYLEGVVENCSLGGMFVITDNLLSKGSVLRLQFQLRGAGENPATIRARAIVRWVRRWTRPKGMGVEFVEFEGLGKDSYEDWASRLCEKDSDSGG